MTGGLPHLIIVPFLHCCCFFVLPTTSLRMFRTSKAQSQNITQAQSSLSDFESIVVLLAGNNLVQCALNHVLIHGHILHVI